MIIKLNLFSCGHATTNLDSCKCSRCGDTKFIKILTSYTCDLNGRYAKNISTKKIVKSRWDLPNFRYCPDQDYDVWK